VAHVHKSNVATADLKEKQQQLGLFEHKLIQSNATRWNSTHDMADRVVEQRPAIDGMYAADDHRPPDKQLYEAGKRITAADYTMLTDMSITLRAFREVSIVIWTYFHSAASLVYLWFDKAAHMVVMCPGVYGRAVRRCH